MMLVAVWHGWLPAPLFSLLDSPKKHMLRLGEHRLRRQAQFINGAELDLTFF